MADLDRLDQILRHVWLEPRSVAFFEWFREYGPVSQLMGQIPRDEAREFAKGNGWRNPDRVVSVALHEEPNWDWWEPRHDQPWRRLAARDAEFKRSGKAVVEWHVR